MQWLFAGFSLSDLILHTGELVQLRLEDIPHKQKPPHRGLHSQSIIKHLPSFNGLSLQQTQQIHLLDLGSMRIDDPNIPLLKYSKQVLILDKLKDHDKVPLVHTFRWIRQPYPLQDLTLIREDKDVLKRRVIFSNRQNLGLVRCDGDWSTEGSGRDEHVLMTEPVKPLPKGILREDIYLVPVFADRQHLPLEVHNMINNNPQPIIEPLYSHLLKSNHPSCNNHRSKYHNININSEMGNAPPPAKKPTMEDTMIEMKMASKRMARESTKSMKESTQYMKKAKEALKKNNEEGAKLYLQSAASKRAESMSIQRMGLKMEFICGNMKTMQNNQAIMGSFDKMTAMLNYSNSPNFQVMSNNLQNFEKTMDEMLINGKMMEELMSNQNGIVDSTADDMLNVLKGELAMETSNQVNQAALIKQKEMEFQEDLKKL